MEECVNIVKQNLPKNLEDFLKLGLIKDGIYKKIEFAIENVIDICNIINSDLKLGIPREEIEIIENLRKNRIISKNLAEKIKSMRGFRNFLVHRYGAIDDRIAFKDIKKGLKDFEIFKKKIEKFISKVKN
jgi:uncharacterized protein YutE (UPF0331/DUF86 family)